MQLELARNLDAIDQTSADAETAPATSQSTFDTSELVPVVGSTAAGPARFWNEIVPSVPNAAEFDDRLQKLLASHDARVVGSTKVRAAGWPASAAASLVQLSHPDELGFIEFVDCAAVKSRHPRALAWRIDGDSMVPRYQDGDLVIISPDEPAVDGYPCVAHQQGQIGVNCKIYVRSGDDVLLIPLNESARPQRLSAADIVWAYRVLFSVRLNPRM